MAIQTSVEKLNKEVKILRQDITEIKAVLLNALKIKEESIKGYKNTSALIKALNKALERHPLS